VVIFWLTAYTKLVDILFARSMSRSSEIFEETTGIKLILESLHNSINTFRSSLSKGISGIITQNIPIFDALSINFSTP